MDNEKRAHIAELTELRRLVPSVCQREALDAAIAALDSQPHAPKQLQECYSNDGGYTWMDGPDDLAFVDGMMVGDIYELRVSHFSWTRCYVVSKVPSEQGECYEVRPTCAAPTQKALSAAGDEGNCAASNATSHAALRAEVEALRLDKERLDSGRMILEHRADEFGCTRTEYKGVDLRKAIDAALEDTNG